MVVEVVAEVLDQLDGGSALLKRAKVAREEDYADMRRHVAVSERMSAKPVTAQFLRTKCDITHVLVHRQTRKALKLTRWFTVCVERLRSILESRLATTIDKFLETSGKNREITQRALMSH